MSEHDPLKTVASADLIDSRGNETTIPAVHNEETYKLISTAKKELADWSVQWGAKPEKDAKAAERLHELREDTADRLRLYRPTELREERERIRNLMSLGDFCRKLNNILGPASDLGSRIFINTPPPVPGFDNQKMKGLFIKMRGMDMFTYHDDLPPGWKKICAVQSPYMSEWGIMNKDERGMFKSWKYIGWRGNVLLRLILAGAITKEEAHTEFGVPQGVEVDREYLRILEEFERGKRPN